jgi:hypothetical protein
MKSGKSVGLLMALAFAACASDIAAQTSADTHSSATKSASEGSTRSLPDMRLWSFGDCDNKFPYFNSDDHKECVRVVGSEEARDARAYRVCETSNARDPEEVARCKSTYKANKDRSAQSGYVPDKAGQQQAAPTAEELQRVRAIASVAVENDKARVRETAQAAPVSEGSAPHEPEPVPEPEEPEGPSALVIVLSLLAAGGGAVAFVHRRQRGDALSAR